MAAPTFLGGSATAFNSTTSPKVASIPDVVPGAILVGLIGMESDGAETGISDVDGNSWTINYNPGGSGSTGHAKIATASAAITNFILDLNFTDTSTLWYGGAALGFVGSNGVGAVVGQAPASNNNSGTISITTTQDNSAVCIVMTDWNAIDNTTRTWATVNGIAPTAGNGYERAIHWDSTHYAAYAAYYPDVGVAGAKTVGVTTPSTGMRAAIAAIEIKGTAGGGGGGPSSGPGSAGMFDPEVISLRNWF